MMNGRNYLALAAAGLIAATPLYGQARPDSTRVRLTPQEARYIRAGRMAQESYEARRDSQQRNLGRYALPTDTPVTRTQRPATGPAPFQRAPVDYQDSVVGGLQTLPWVSYCAVDAARRGVCPPRTQTGRTQAQTGPRRNAGTDIVSGDLDTRVVGNWAVDYVDDVNMANGLSFNFTSRNPRYPVRVQFNQITRDLDNEIRLGDASTRDYFRALRSAAPANRQEDLNLLNNSVSDSDLVITPQEFQGVTPGLYSVTVTNGQQGFKRLVYLHAGEAGRTVENTIGQDARDAYNDSLTRLENTISTLRGDSIRTHADVRRLREDSATAARRQQQTQTAQPTRPATGQTQPQAQVALESRLTGELFYQPANQEVIVGGVASFPLSSRMRLGMYAQGSIYVGQRDLFGPDTTVTLRETEQVDEFTYKDRTDRIIGFGNERRMGELGLELGLIPGRDIELGVRAGVGAFRVSKIENGEATVVYSRNQQTLDSQTVSDSRELYPVEYSPSLDVGARLNLSKNLSLRASANAARGNARARIGMGWTF